MSAQSNLPTYRDMLRKAQKEKRYIVASVLMANDDVKRFRFGPRGGAKQVKVTAA